MPGLLLVLIWLTCSLFEYLRWRQRSRLNEPPVYPGAWPVVGHLFKAIGRKKLWNFMRKVGLDVSHGEGVCTILAGPIKLYAVCNPNDSLTIANQCLDKSFYYKFAKPWLGDSLLTSESAEWKKDRKMLMPAFRHQVLEGFMESFNKDAIQVAEKLSEKVDKGSFEPSPYINEYTIETLCKTVLGADIPNKLELIHVMETLMDVLLKKSLNTLLHIETIYNWTKLKKLEDKYTKFCKDIGDEIIEKKKIEMKGKIENNTGMRKNFLDLLLDISRVEAMSDVRMRDQLNLMITAGFDTISIALHLILVMIGSHENVQEKIYKEIIENIDGTSGEVKQSELDKLVYLEAVIKESMRLFPSAPIVLREIKENIRLENYTLYAGHSCMLLLGAVNLHPIWGEDAQLFKPERWLNPAMIPNHPAAFAAFSIGRRNCIGKFYAMMSMKTFVVHVIRNFIITADWTKMELAEDALLRVESGHHISLQRRS